MLCSSLNVCVYAQVKHKQAHAPLITTHIAALLQITSLTMLRKMKI